MFADFVFPDGNEEKFIEIAIKLGISKLYFIYDSEDKKKNNIKNSEFGRNKHINIRIGFIPNKKTSNLEKSELMIAKSSDNDRFLIESGKLNLIYGFEQATRKDFMSQKASGLNHIICEAANKNKVAIGFSYSSIINEPGFKKSVILGRMMQNIMLCRKYKVRALIGSFHSNPYMLRSPHDLISLFSTLGMDKKKSISSLNSSF